MAAAAQVSTTKKAITTAKLLFMPFVFKAETNVSFGALAHRPHARLLRLPLSCSADEIRGRFVVKFRNK